jgi:hypothetical protein
MAAQENSVESGGAGRYMAVARSRHVLLPSLKIALVVGSVLNAINQGPALLAGSELDWLNLSLNFLVPYCVATYSATRNEVASRPQS